ncbi:hypothetical protein [Carnobacterium funditum]|uniref:hypothetical protein n=1 Tax=Carnobacterium funditum TaxID=2752 RepID=UPI0005587DBC|nr:hypothetical protein [Carnobacterium funditum]
MNVFKMSALTIACIFILGACGTEETSNNDSYPEVVESESITPKEDGLDKLDQSTTDEFAKIGSVEEIDWEKINLNKRQFKEYIESLDEREVGNNVDSEDSPKIVSSLMTDDNTIELVISNSDKSEMSEITNGFFTLIMDSFSRQLYLNSDFYDGTTHPTIIIKDDEDHIISDATDFIKMEDTE